MISSVCLSILDNNCISSSRQRRQQRNNEALTAGLRHLADVVDPCKANKIGKFVCWAAEHSTNRRPPQACCAVTGTKAKRYVLGFPQQYVLLYASIYDTHYTSIFP